MSAVKASLHDYLTHPSLMPLWEAVAARLERTRLEVSGTVQVVLDEAGAFQLSGLLPSRVRAGRVRVKLPELDAALRNSAAAAGLVGLVPQLTGTALVDRKAAREERDGQRTATWGLLDAALADAGVADADWVPPFLERLRRAGTLTRTGQSAPQVIATVRAVLIELARHGLLTWQPDPGSIPARWELGQLASLAGGSAHALDSDTVAGTIVLRALAALHDQPVPTTPAQRRELWALAGVTSDTVSGTVLVWALRPAGEHPWAGMMRARADLGLVTHLTLQELATVPADVPLAAAGSVVHACENPQVLQAAARAGVDQPVICFSGNPAGAGALLLERLVTSGLAVRYHGDFDWPGVQIVGRMIAAGATVWRMTAADYRAAVASVDADAQLPLDGTGRAGWDPELTAVMREVGWAVHEEALLPVLLADLRGTGPAPLYTPQPPAG